MSLSRTILVAILAFTLVGCSNAATPAQREAIEGSGVLTTETRPVSGFTQIVLAGPGSAKVVFGDSDALVIEAEDNLLPYLTAAVSGSRLTLGTKPNTDLHPSRPIRYTITVRDLDGITISGSANADIPQVGVDRLEFELSGSGTITAAGAVDELVAELSGSGSVLTGDLQALAADVSLPGSGTLVVWATQRLHITLGGSGNVNYYGHPLDFQQEVHGSGSVHDLGDRVPRR
jgi:hypothetical protein